MIFSVLIFGIFGIAIGSFINVWSLRSLHEKSLNGRSECPHCHHQLGFLDLVPVFSFLFLRGRCRYCHKKISIQYPLVEASGGVLFLISGYLILTTYPSALNLPTLFLILTSTLGIATLLCVFITDYLAGIIPNRVIIPAILLLLALKLLNFLVLIVYTYFVLASDSHGLGKYLLPPYSDYFYIIVARYGWPIFYDLLAGLGIGLAFYLLVLFTRGRAMGGGDIKLGFFVGVLNGWPLSLVALMIAFTTGALFSVGLLLVGRKKFGQTISFGPFLVLGSLAALFWGQQLFSWYTSLIHIR